MLQYDHPVPVVTPLPQVVQALNLGVGLKKALGKRAHSKCLEGFTKVGQEIASTKRKVARLTERQRISDERQRISDERQRISDTNVRELTAKVTELQRQLEDFLPRNGGRLRSGGL